MGGSVDELGKENAAPNKHIRSYLVAGAGTLRLGMQPALTGGGNGAEILRERVHVFQLNSEPVKGL